MAEQISREEFLSFMISELSAVQQSSGLASTPPLSTEELLQKFSYDFPLLDEPQVEQLTSYILSLKHGVSFEVPRKQFMNEKFVENLCYIATAQSYATNNTIHHMMGACYLSMPLCCLHMTGKYFNNIFPRPQVSCDSLQGVSLIERVYDNALHQVFHLIKCCTPSLLLPKGITSASHTSQTLRDSTTNALCQLICVLIDVVALPFENTRNSVDKNDTLLFFLSQKFRKECIRDDEKVTTNLDEGSDMTSVVSAVMDTLTHLLYTARDIVIISPQHFKVIMKTVADKAFSINPSYFMDKRVKKKKVQTDNIKEDGVSIYKVLVKQLHMLIFYSISQISQDFYLKYSSSSKRSPSQSSAYSDLIGLMCKNMSKFVMMTENLSIYLQNEANEQSRYIKVMDNIVESLSHVGIIMVESFYSSTLLSNNVKEAEDVFLTSQLLPFLARTTFAQITFDHTNNLNNSLYAALSPSARQNVLRFFLGISLTTSSDGKKPFVTYIFRSIFPLLCNSDPSIFSAIGGSKNSTKLSLLSDSASLYLPSILGFIYSAVESKLSSPDYSYSDMFCRTSEALCTKISQLNRHCFNVDDSYNSTGSCSDTSSLCSCSKDILHTQKLLNSLLNEINYTTWTIASKYQCTCSPIAHIKVTLQRFILSLSEAINELSSSSQCPTYLSELNRDAPVTNTIDNDQFNELFSGDDKLEGEKLVGAGDISESICAESWRTVYSERRALTYGILKNVKILNSVLDGSGVSKTD